MASRARRIPKSVHSAELAVFRDLMVAARDEADLTQEKLAKRLKIHQSFIAKYEGGERRLDVVEFLWVTRAIGADPIKILQALMRRRA